MNTPETAPKDREILIDVGLPFMVVGVWSEVDTQWVYANPQIGLYQGEWIDTYFENEREKSIKGWLPIPEVER